MRNKRKKYISVLLLVTLFFTASCSNNKQSSSDIHLRKAEIHERSAKDSREHGNDRMAEYYNEEAQKERYKVVDSCDLFDITLAIITLGFFDCG